MASRLARIRSRPFGATLVVALLCFGWLSQVSPWIGVYQIDPDEGLNLGKAALVAAGYRPYGEIWNDQGPILTYLLSGLQFIAPNDTYAARLLVIGMASLLLASLYATIRRDGGHVAAFVAVVLLATSPYFVRLSSAVMIGLPAMSLAMLALAVINTGSRRAALRTAVSGLLFGLSLQTKLFTFTIVPALLVAVTGLPATNLGRKAVHLAGIWIVACVLAFALVAAISGEIPLRNLVEPHLASELRTGYALARSLSVIWETLLQSAAILIPGVLGLLALPFLPKLRKGSFVLPAIWLATGFLALSLHHPVQTHQVLLLVVPLAWIAALFIASFGGLVASFSRLPPRAAPAVSVALAACAAAYGLFTLPSRGALAAPQSAELSRLAVEVYAPLGGWVVVDQPLAAFRNGLLVPPELVVFSQKRLMTGNLTNEDLIASIERRRPTQVVFQRFRIPEAVSARLVDDYVVAHRGISAPQFIQYVARQPDVSLNGAALRRRLADLVATMAATNVIGGYAAEVDLATGNRFGESRRPIGPDKIWMRPAGATYEIGQRFLRAHVVTGEERYYDLALGTALAIARTQGCHGGWTAESGLHTECGSGSAGSPAQADFDEGMQAGAIAFMLDVAAVLPEAQNMELMRASRDGLAFLLETQNEGGAWPLAPFMTSDYRRFSTLNDDVSTSHIRVLLKAYKIFGDESYLAAARRGLDFLLAAQLESGGWAQQYDAGLRPEAARKFEPVAAASIETAYAIDTLLEGHGTFRDPHLLAAAARAEAWLAASQIGPETWSRFYEIGTNRPIFGDRDGRVHYSLDEISKERRNGYRWVGRYPDVTKAIRLVRAALDGDTAYAAEKAAIAEARQLEHLARALGEDAGGKSRRARANRVLSAERWMASIDVLLAQIEFAGGS